MEGGGGGWGEERRLRGLGRRSVRSETFRESTFVATKPTRPKTRNPLSFRLTAALAAALSAIAVARSAVVSFWFCAVQLEVERYPREVERLHFCSRIRSKYSTLLDADADAGKDAVIDVDADTGSHYQHRQPATGCLQDVAKVQPAGE